jgi:O-acetyl-ADP-ribose deacetylase (regulator of RNase III)
MKIVIFDRDPEKVSWFNFCMSGMTDVTCVVTEDFASLSVDAFVSPANSFGYMNGGIDLAYENKWPGIGKLVQDYILRNYVMEEVLVGEGFYIGLPNDEQNRALIVAPTMRIPSRIPPINVYLATRAAIFEGYQYSAKAIAIPGMGTGSGGVKPAEAGWAMRKAIIAARKNNCDGNIRTEFPAEWRDIAAEHLTVSQSMPFQDSVESAIEGG